MTRDQALTLLNLPPEASREDIDEAYGRLVRRYPPEFQPEKFRRIDMAFRFLTSFAARLESLLSRGSASCAAPGKELIPVFIVPPAPASLLDAALAETGKAARLTCLWSPPEQPGGGR